MTAIPRSSSWITPDEYLAGEGLADVRHEYVDGQVFGMAGASQDHNRITGNILAYLHQALRGKKCEPFATDMKLRIPPRFADVFYYPDVMVACDPSDNADLYRERPSVLFEIISPNTEKIDRREKVLAYRQIPSLTVYSLVEQDLMRVTVFRRAKTGWSTEVLEGELAVLKLPSIRVEMPLVIIYERTSVLAVPKRGKSAVPRSV